MKYTIKRSAKKKLRWEWDSTAWEKANTLEIKTFHRKSSRHRPRTLVRMLYDAKGIYCFFKVFDKYVRATKIHYQEYVCMDSCVEFFVRPKPGAGYINFELNCCGTLLCYYITDHSRVRGGFTDFRRIPLKHAKKLQVYHTYYGTVEPEIKNETIWYLGLFIPYTFLSRYVGRLGKIKGQVWRGNFFKCGDKTSHPHWGSWTKITPLNFHQPRRFGNLRLE